MHHKPLDHHFYLFNRLGIIYNEIPKCGSTSILKSFGCGEGWIDASVSVSGNPRLAHQIIPVSRATAFIHNDYKKIVALRHPFSRLISGFLDKFIMGNEIQFIQARYKAASFVKKDNIDELNFNDFIFWLSDSNLFEIDKHFKPQYLFVGEEKYDIVMNADRLTSEWKSNSLDLICEYISTPFHSRINLSTKPSIEIKNLSTIKLEALKKLLFAFKINDITNFIDSKNFSLIRNFIYQDMKLLANFFPTTDDFILRKWSSFNQN